MTIDNAEVTVYTVPTDAPESDGTFVWDKTTMVMVKARCAGETGIGYSYADAGTAIIARGQLLNEVVGLDPMDIPTAWAKMVRKLRNLGACGPGAMAISAVDNALWDLKARLLGLPLVSLLGAVRAGLPIYGSGGFTSYSDEQLLNQFSGWAEQGITRMKMKVGREPGVDPHRVSVARQAVGEMTEVFVDANSAYDRKTALYFMERFAGDFDVRWMEQPLLPEDRVGMRWLRDRGPARMDVVDGEYGYELPYFRDMIAAEAVDVVMADATRCCGITGFLKVGALCEAHQLPMSSHCAPLLHLHAGCAAPAMIHAEYFHDHVRIERLFFDGIPEPKDGQLVPNLSAPGFGVSFKASDAEQYRNSF